MGSQMVSGASVPFPPEGAVQATKGFRGLILDARGRDIWAKLPGIREVLGCLGAP